MVIYWLQQPGGLVLIRDDNTYKIHQIQGLPTSFIEQASSKFQVDVELWFGEDEAGYPSSVSLLRDQDDRPRLTAAVSGNKISFAWIQNTEDAFMTNGTIDLRPAIKSQSSGLPFDVSVSEDRQQITLDRMNQSNERETFTLSAAEVDQLILDLAATREGLKQEIPYEIEPGTKLLSVINPTWRTRTYPHPSIPGPILSLRHPGLGWLSFILPANEALNLGSWLVKATKSQTPT